MSAVLCWVKNAPGSYSAVTENGETYTAYGDSVSADIAQPEWKVAYQPTGAPLTYVGQAARLRDAKTVAQEHHNSITTQKA